MRDLAKALARGVAMLVALPALVSFLIRRTVFGADRALEGSTQALALVPGLSGEYIRRAFLSRTLARFDRTATVEFGTIFSQVGTQIDERVYVGPRCHLGLVHLECDVLLAAGVHVPSGSATHGVSELDRPIRDQPGARTEVRIGEGTWVGSGAIVMAHVGRHCVIGAGAVVTTPIPDYAVAVGVPARVVRSRRLESAGA